MNEHELERRVDALYAAPLEDFIAERKKLSLELKALGRKDAAARVASLPKPNAIASSVNRLHAQEPAVFAKLLAAGARVREAFARSLAGDAGPGEAASLSRAQAAQREAITEATTAIERAASASGRPLSPASAAKIGPTVHAISTTGRFGDAQPGRLLRELEPPGLEVLAELAPSVSPARHEEPSPEPEPPREPVADSGARARLEAERTRVEAELAVVEEELAELGRASAALEGEDERAADRERAAGESAREAGRAVSEARGRVMAAEAELERARSALARAEEKAGAIDDEVSRARAARESVRAKRATARARAEELEARRAGLRRVLGSAPAS